VPLLASAAASVALQLAMQAAGRRVRSALANAPGAARAQVIPMLIRGGHRQDYLIVNFGLHFTEDYKGELQTIIEQARSARCRLGRPEAQRLCPSVSCPAWSWVAASAVGVQGLLAYVWATQ